MSGRDPAGRALHAVPDLGSVEEIEASAVGIGGRGGGGEPAERTVVAGRGGDQPAAADERRQAKELIDFAIKNWMKFGWEASLQAGVGDHPSRPHIGFLLAYHHVAVNMLESANQKSVKPVGSWTEPVAVEPWHPVELKH